MELVNFNKVRGMRCEARLTVDRRKHASTNFILNFNPTSQNSITSSRSK